MSAGVNKGESNDGRPAPLYYTRDGRQRLFAKTAPPVIAEVIRVLSSDPSKAEVEEQTKALRGVLAFTEYKGGAS